MASSIHQSFLYAGLSSTSRHPSGFEKSLTERGASRRLADGVLTVAQAFYDLMSVIEPTAAQRTAASEQQRRVRAELETRLSLINTYLSGSYRRHTLIKPVTDIDLLVVLDAARHSIGFDAAGVKHALDVVLSALEDAYPKTEKKRESRCIVMQFAGSGIGFDIVPVIQVVEHEFWMPDEDSGRWIRTNPREVERLVSEANQNTCDEWLVPLVKLLKAWKRNCGAPLRGFHLEAMAYHALKHAPENERRGLQFLFEQLKTAIWYTTSDIWPQGEAPSDSVSATNRLRAAAMLENATRIAAEANAADQAGRTIEAHEKWFSLFGDRYPETGTQRAEGKRAPLNDALSIIKQGRPFSATSAGIMPVTAGYAAVRSSTSHGGDVELFEAAELTGVAGSATPAALTPEQELYLEAEIARALSQFPALERVDVATAAADTTLWPVRPDEGRRLHAVLVGTQGTNYGTSHRILVKVPRDMPATEPRVYLLRQRTRGTPISRHGAISFVAKGSIKHQWKDGAMCSHALRDKWDGRLVTMLVHAADWLLRQEHYRRTHKWIGHEIDARRRHLLNGETVEARPEPRAHRGAHRDHSQ